MIPLILTILCSTSIALLLKYNDMQKGHPILLLAGNYMIASVISFGMMIRDANATFYAPTLIFGALLAILFVFSFFAFARAVTAAGTALAATSSRLSAVIPVFLSMAIYNEQPTAFQFYGFLFAFVTIVLFYLSIRRMSRGTLQFKDYFYLFAVLTGIGCGDFCIKVFQQSRPISEKPLFLFSIFTFSFLYTLLIIYFQKISIEKRTFLRGIILGVPNIFSTFFLIGALVQLPAIIVYPATNIGIILLTTISAVMFMHERLNRFGILALLSGIVSIYLLTI